MGSTDPIRRVSALSTGAVTIRPEHAAATWKPTLLWAFTSRRWTQPLPVNAYLIEHRDGLVLFDTGQDRASVIDPGGYYPGGVTGLVYRRTARFDIGPADTLGAQLAALGHQLGDVRTAVVSHLHTDHIGGLGELAGGDTEIAVSHAEWRSMQRPMAELRGRLRAHIQLPGLRWRRLEPEASDDPAIAPFRAGHDLFGDGSMVLLPTPGHTPGSLSLLVRRPKQVPLLLVGDLTYDAHLLEHGHIPGLGARRQLHDTTAMVNALRHHHPDMVILPAHDPGAAARLAAATGDDPVKANKRG